MTAGGSPDERRGALGNDRKGALGMGWDAARSDRAGKSGMAERPPATTGLAPERPVFVTGRRAGASKRYTADDAMAAENKASASCTKDTVHAM